MSLVTILVVILILTGLVILPVWPYSRFWGFAPSNVVGLVVVILVSLVLMGRI